MKLNREQIVKALECCYMQELGHDENCQECPYAAQYVHCAEQLGKDALALIRDLTESLDRVQKQCGEIIGECDERDAERLKQIAKLTEENERLGGVGLPDYSTYIRSSDAKTAITAYIGEQTVSKYASQVECKAARNGAEGALNELDYIAPAQVSCVADTVRKMQERFYEKASRLLGADYRSVIDQTAKELLEDNT